MLNPDTLAALETMGTKLESLDMLQAITEVDEARALVDTLSDAISKGDDRLWLIDGRLAELAQQGSGAAAGDALLRGADVREVDADPEALRRERASLAAGVADLERRKAAAAQVRDRKEGAATRRMGLVANEMVDPLKADLADVLGRLAEIYATARTLAEAVDAFQARQLSDKLEDPIYGLRALLKVADETAPVPPPVSDALQRAEPLLSQLGRHVPTRIRLPIRPILT